MYGSQDSLDSRATGYRLHDRGSNPGRIKFFHFSTMSRPDFGPTQARIEWVSFAICPGIKQRGRETDHSFPSSAEVKNDRAVPLLPRTSSWHSA
jgi:hypothetical protein